MSAKKRKCGVNAAKIKLGVYRQTGGLPFRQPFLTLLNPSSLVIAVRVSGGHLCEAEAPTEPAGEAAARCAAIRFSFETPTQAEIVIRFVLNLRNKKALIPVKHYGEIKAFKFVLSYICHIA